MNKLAHATALMPERTAPAVLAVPGVPGVPVVPAGPAGRAQSWSSIGDAVLNEGAFVLRIVRRLGVRAADVEDVAQEVFIVMHRRHGDWDSNVPLRAWIFGIVRRTVANHLRKAHVRHEISDAGVASSDAVHRGETQEDALQRSRDRALLELALSRLDAEKREVFVLYELEGFSMDEVASFVGCPVKTAYSRLHTARVIVQRFVARERTHRRLR